MDDVQLGSGDATDADAWAVEEEAMKRNEVGDGFKQHLEAIRRVLARARRANLKFKWEVTSLGLVVGCGCVRADPSKTSAITLWPRPSRKEDAERFLATMVFLRDHMSG